MARRGSKGNAKKYPEPAQTHLLKKTGALLACPIETQDK
eukprot:CAMPEP_0204236270 /NCGR_PEP_ID=MMETSP0361-20130328/92336_1 /ASSEMBLY_ACC=CAM_ASM_000343 /TAXON_ID=268821 /ORGANISM="Scrippsiella Hangoei, Strain SHTV-5" /LENGTH=38 /DNA_ID= /DNA_START= /DNA_END= /DNA_ORIENTATION=